MNIFSLAMAQDIKLTGSPNKRDERYSDSIDISHGTVRIEADDVTTGKKYCGVRIPTWVPAEMKEVFNLSWTMVSRGFYFSKHRWPCGQMVVNSSAPWTEGRDSRPTGYSRRPVGLIAGCYDVVKHGVVKSAFSSGAWHERWAFGSKEFPFWWRLRLLQV